MRIARIALLALVLTMMTSSTALAVEVEGEGEGEGAAFTVTGSPIAGEPYEFVFEDELALTCSDVKFHSAMPGPSSTVTGTTEHKECVFGKGMTKIGATMNMKGCDFLFHLTAKIAADTFTSTVDVACPTGEGPTITALTCEVEIEPKQNGLGPVTFIDETNGHVKLKPEIVEDISYVKKKDGVGCPLTGTGTKEDGSLRGALTLFKEKGPLSIKG